MRKGIFVGGRFKTTPRSCTFCGCTADKACPGGCAWSGTAGAGEVCTACVALAAELGFVVMKFLRDDRDTMLDRWASLERALRAAKPSRRAK